MPTTKKKAETKATTIKKTPAKKVTSTTSEKKVKAVKAKTTTTSASTVVAKAPRVKKPKAKVVIPTAFAVIETGSKQYKVAEGTVITIEKLDGVVVGDTISFDKVVLLETGSATTLGAPYIVGAKVTGTLAEEGKGEKIRIQRFKSKSNWHRAYGHRQPFMKVTITKIG